jgi:glucuronosyltransferase
MRDRAFHFIAAASKDEIGPLYRRWDDAFKYFMHQPSEDMAAGYFISQVKIKEVKLWAEEFYRLTLKYFKGPVFAELLKAGKFDLIVLEDHISPMAMVTLIHYDIPKIGVYCIAGAREVGERNFGLPGLINSVPSLTNNVTNSPPSFADRWQILMRNTRSFAAFLTVMNVIVGETPGMSVEKYFTAIYDVVFVNDHPAFSFPFLTPPNTFYLGTSNLEGLPLNPLPKDYQDFLTNCPHQRVVYFSLGSYLQDITTFSGTPALIETLRKVDACVILKSKVDLTQKFHLSPAKFLQRTWIPQRDLLGSGKLDFFISHCGNNGRLEAIFYNVPLLCIPLFGDQYHNARLVERNNFGTIITWETLTEETLSQTVHLVFRDRDDYAANMKKAAEIARNDPGAGTKALQFYADLLIRNKNADYLTNRIILDQSMVEIYNLDIAAAALISTVCLIAVINFLIFKMCRVFMPVCRKIFYKIKTD